MYPKARLDALSDAIFGVSMTLLVLDVRPPEAFHPHDGRELVHGLAELLPKFLPYVLSFVVLGLRWPSNIHVRSREETCSRKYAEWWLITCVPLATMVVGRFAEFAPAIWLYAGNTILICAVSFRMLVLTPSFERADHLRDRQIALAMLAASCVLAIGWSFFSPRQALWALLLNVAGPRIRRWMGGPE